MRSEAELKFSVLMAGCIATLVAAAVAVAAAAAAAVAVVVLAYACCASKMLMPAALAGCPICCKPTDHLLLQWRSQSRSSGH